MPPRRPREASLGGLPGGPGRRREAFREALGAPGTSPEAPDPNFNEKMYMMKEFRYVRALEL